MSKLRNRDRAKESRSFIQRHKHAENATEIILQLPQPLCNRLDFAPAEIVKRYLRNELAVAFEITYEVGRDVFRYSALVLNPSQEVVRDMEGCCRCHDHQSSVFIDNVKLVQNREVGVDGVGAMVWLKPLYQVQNAGIGDSLYLSLVFGRQVFLGWPFVKNGKSNERDVFSTVSVPRKVPNDMVKARSQVMNDLTRENTKSKWNQATLVVLDCLRDGLQVIIADDWVFGFFKKPCDLGLKITDILVGPA